MDAAIRGEPAATALASGWAAGSGFRRLKFAAEVEGHLLLLGIFAHFGCERIAADGRFNADELDLSRVEGENTRRLAQRDVNRLFAGEGGGLEIRGEGERVVLGNRSLWKTLRLRDMRR